MKTFTIALATLLALAAATIIDPKDATSYSPSVVRDHETDNAMETVEPEEMEEWEESDTIANLSPDQLRDLRATRLRVRQTGCPINLCFALQGDRFITENQFQRQKDFIELIVAITTTDERGNFCAVQYGRTTSSISPLTERRIEFLNLLQGANKVGGRRTNIAAALAYTGFQVRTQTEQPRKIIILGDGEESVGGAPAAVADIIRQDGAEISAVAIGRFRNRKAWAEVTGSLERVVNPNSFLDLGEIVNAIVNDVCGI